MINVLSASRCAGKTTALVKMACNEATNNKGRSIAFIASTGAELEIAYRSILQTVPSKRIKGSCLKNYINFRNGSVIRFFLPISKLNGMRFDEVYIDNANLIKPDRLEEIHKSLNYIMSPGTYTWEMTCNE